MRLLFLTAAASMLLPVAVAAQGVDIPTQPRQRVVTVFGNEACPKSKDPNEIIVCSRRPADEQFRIPPAVRNEAVIARKDDVSRRTALVDHSIAPVNCSAVGTQGQFGCSQGLNILGAAKAVKDAVNGDLTPVPPPAPPQ